VFGFEFVDPFGVPETGADSSALRLIDALGLGVTGDEVSLRQTVVS
jgi:hypothetical protein